MDSVSLLDNRLRRLRRLPRNPLKSFAELCCGSAEVALQVIEIIAEVLRNVVSPNTPLRTSAARQRAAEFVRRVLEALP